MNERAQIAVFEARQSMLRVWMAISAVWVAFWLITAAVALTAFQPHSPINVQLGLFAIIVATPPVALLAIGALSRWIFESVALRARR